MSVVELAGAFLFGVLVGWRLRHAWGWYKVRREWQRIIEQRRQVAAALERPSEPPTGNGWSPPSARPPR